MARLTEQQVQDYRRNGYTLYHHQLFAPERLEKLAGIFHGAMGELLCAMEERRAPLHSARNNLRSLELTFAAIASARHGVARTPGEVRSLPQQ